MASAEQLTIDRPRYEIATTGPRDFASDLTTELILGERKLRLWGPALCDLRQRWQDDDFTTEPGYFIAANTSKQRRVGAALIRRQGELEACVLFFEHCRLGIGLGVIRGGDGIGESLVIGPAEWRTQYVHVATQALLGHWRMHGVSLVMMAAIDHCMQVMEPGNLGCVFSGRNIQRKLPLAATYRGMLDALGPRTRRSLAKKREQLEEAEHVEFVPSLDPTVALEAMLQLRTQSQPQRDAAFYEVRCELVIANPECFCMGMRLPSGAWLSVLSGWRHKGITYVDLQMNDARFKKESLSAVMRAYLLEHEIDCGQHLINFIGGTSLLLQRYCRPVEQCTHAFFWRPSLRARLVRRLLPYLQAKNGNDRLRF